MFTILGADGKEYGPVAADKIQSWITGGRANLQTKARRDGETEWRTLGDFAEFSGAAAGAPAAFTPPVAPGGAATAAPAATSPVDAKAFAEALLARAAPLDVFGCLGRAFELWKTNFLPLVGATLVVTLIMMVLGVIPVLGSLVNLVFAGVFYGGLYYFYLGKLRGEPREIADAFAGFTRALAPLILANLLTVVISAVAACVLIGPWAVFVFLAAREGGTPNPLLFAGMAACALPLVYLSVSWMFTFLLVIDKGLGPWTAMEVSRRVITRYWFGVFVTVLLGAILAALGLIGLVIGVLFTLPLAFGAVVCAYEDLCNPPPAA
jgi:hypothetical protein